MRRPLLLLFVLLSVAAMAQGDRLRPRQQQELWTSFTVQGGLPGFMKDLVGKGAMKRFRLTTELGYRSADVFFAGRQVYIEPSVRYKLSDHWLLTVEHRAAFRPGRTNRHRTCLTVNYRTQWKRFKFNHRLSYQHNYRDFGEQREVVRNRSLLTYDFRNFKLDPEISTEFFTWFGHRGARYIGVRHTIGTDWSINKVHSIGFKLVHDREHGVAWPTYRWIYAISYTFDLRER
jgi:hypothetical protein